MKRIIIGIILLCGVAFASCSSSVVQKAEYSSGITSSAGSETVTAPVSTTSTVSTSATTAAATTTEAVTTTVTGEPPADLVLVCQPSVEVYTTVSAADFITDTNAELIAPDTIIDTAETGAKTMKLELIKDGVKFEKEISYSVTDTQAPVILNSGWEPYVKKGEAFDPGRIVGYVDNYDRAPVLTYTGEVNTAENGSYPITATVTDSSGNSTSFDLTVLVLDEIPTPEDNNARVTLGDFKAAHPYENVRFGIDVSAWQTNVDYNAAKADGVEFVIMRMGYCYSELVKDEYYDRNMEEATKAGLDVGVYFYCTDNTEEKVREHAKWMIDQLGGRKLAFPIAFDWEEFGRFQRYGMNSHDLNELFEVFCDEVGKAGYTAMLYSSRNFLLNFWTNRGGHPVWLAHYVDETNYEGDYVIWQVSAYGRVAGIDGDVDLNIQYMDRPLS